MSHDCRDSGAHGEAAMHVQAFDALADADRLYAEYSKLKELGDLAFFASTEERRREIVASVSPVLSEDYENAIVG